jgi:hypothetical protein
LFSAARFSLATLVHVLSLSPLPRLDYSEDTNEDVM